MAVNLAKLVVRLEAESSRLQTELERTNRSLAKFERGAKRTGQAVKGIFTGIVAAVSVAAFAAATRSALDYADAIDKAAKVSGLANTELQELRFAGEQLGISNKLIDEGFRRFSRRLGEFANSGGGPAQKAMEGLNIEIRDSAGAVRSTGDVFNELLQKMGSVESQAQRSAIAAQVFGDDAGPKLEQLLAQGVSGLQAFRDEAADIGAILSDDIIDNAVQAKDDLARLSRVLKVQLTAAIVELAPVLTKAANGLIDMARAARAAFGDINSLGKAAAETRLTRLFDELEELDGKIAEATRRESSNAAVDRLVDNFLPVIPASRLEERKQEIEADINELYARISEIDFAAQNKPKSTVLDFDFTGTGTRKKGEKTQAELDAERLAAALKSIKNPADDLTQTFVDYNTLLEAGSISWDTYAEAVFKAQDRIEAFGEDATKATKEADAAAKELGLTFTSAFESAVLEGQKLREVLKGLAKDILAIALRRTVTEPLGDFVTSAISGFFATGTGFAPGGAAVVGERGPEVINLPRGSTVTPIGQVSGGINISVDARGSNDPAAIEDAVARAVSLSISTVRNMRARGKLPEFG